VLAELQAVQIMELKVQTLFSQVLLLPAVVMAEVELTEVQPLMLVAPVVLVAALLIITEQAELAILHLLLQPKVLMVELLAVVVVGLRQQEQEEQLPEKVEMELQLQLVGRLFITLVVVEVEQLSHQMLAV
jgi:hypothetical protein